MLFKEVEPARPSSVNLTITIGFPLVTDLNNDTIQSLCHAINQSYSLSAPSLWKPTHNRIDISSLKKLLEENKILLAKIDNNIAGCIKFSNAEDYIEFGLLFTDQHYQRKGVASALIKAVEDMAVKQKLPFIQLKVIMPTIEISPHQIFLKQWYEKLGYIFHYKEPCNIEAQKSLALTCEFWVYRKPAPTLDAKPSFCPSCYI